MITPLDAAAPAKTTRRKLAAVDADVHESFNRVTDLLPYLGREWHRFLTDYSWSSVAAAYPYALPRTGRGARLDWVLPDGRTMGSDLDAMRQQLFDQEGVEIGILNGFLHVSAMKGWHELATALASAYNDWQIANWLDKEPRLRGSVHMAVQDPQRAAREIDRLGDHPQIVQVFLPTINDRQYGDPMYLPIFEAAARHDLVVALHHGHETESAVGYGRYFIEWHTTAPPQTMMCQLASLIFAGVLERLPALKVVCLETSFTWLPHFMWRSDEQFRSLRSEVPWVKRLPSVQMREQVRVDTQPLEDISKQALLQVIDQMGTDRMLLFGTDYPHWDSDSPRDGLPRGLPRDLLERILSLNARETYSRL